MALNRSNSSNLGQLALKGLSHALYMSGERANEQNFCVPVGTITMQGRRKEFSFGAIIVHRVWGRWSLGGVQGRSLEFGGQSPTEAEAVCRHFLQILTAETIKFENYAHLHPD